MAESITYFVKDMRVLPLSEKVAEKNPDRAFTVAGSEFRTANADGKPGDVLSIQSKAVEKDDVKSPLFAINVKNGTLTLPEGRRGREKSAGMDAATLQSLIEGLRG